MKIISNNDIIIVIIIIKVMLTSILRTLIKNPIKKIFMKKKKLELDINFGEVIGSQGIKCH